MYFLRLSHSISALCERQQGVQIRLKSPITDVRSISSALKAEAQYKSKYTISRISLNYKQCSHPVNILSMFTDDMKKNAFDTTSKLRIIDIKIQTFGTLTFSFKGWIKYELVHGNVRV